ncbi:DUF7716 domain-containing protein [Shewanella nanhaiensis]|uniref:DUF7716 domain-containing protein n=1 Tax=Shewanella nanhaiensis TaxID=2864872 RepID=A0ABS7E6W9_9GAMM|nr:hypothetical protein [Shewanella nanhaiensis]MBW8185433.1 hypothetical protein [Shewanella nanhaiensis]
MSKDTEAKNLGDILYNCDDIDWDLALYLGSNDSFNLNMEVIIHDPDDVEDDEDDNPKVVEEKNYMYILSIQDIQSIKDNLEQQTNRIATREELLLAFEYYYRNDAFMEVELK